MYKTFQEWHRKFPCTVHLVFPVWTFIIFALSLTFPPEPFECKLQNQCQVPTISFGVLQQLASTLLTLWGESPHPPKHSGWKVVTPLSLCVHISIRPKLLLKHLLDVSGIWSSSRSPLAKVGRQGGEARGQSLLFTLSMRFDIWSCSSIKKKILLPYHLSCWPNLAEHTLLNIH